MPDAAAGLADVGAGNADPLEVLRGDEHPAQQLAVVGLNLFPLDQRPACRGDPVGETVADRLQLTEVEHPRRGGCGCDPVGHIGVSEGVAEEPRQLRLEPGDLPAQLQPRLALVDSAVEPGELLSSQQGGHPEKCSHAASRVAAAIHNASSTAIWGTPLTWIAATAMRRLVRVTP